MTRTTRSVAVGWLACVMLAGCGVKGASPTAQWATRVDSDRQLADRYVADGLLDEAEGTLRRRLASSNDDVDEKVRIQLTADLRFALGRVLLLQKRYTLAIEQATLGLALGGQDTVFRANLYGLRAMATEADGRPLDALDDYARALAIHKTLFDAAVAAREST